MLFKEKQNLNGIESFNPDNCKMNAEESVKFTNDNVAMGCGDGCWDGCIGSCRRFQH